MTRLMNPRLAALQQLALAERHRRGDSGYVDEHVKRVAIHLVIEDIELSTLSRQQSLAIGAELGLSVDQYLSAVAWLDPGHAARIQEISCNRH
jgi:hypothetical protein